MKSVEALVEEALAPLAHDLTCQVKASPDLVVAHPGCGKQNDPGANHITMRRRITSCEML
jgi:hypothetical protein